MNKPETISNLTFKINLQHQTTENRSRLINKPGIVSSSSEKIITLLAVHKIEKAIMIRLRVYKVHQT